MADFTSIISSSAAKGAYRSSKSLAGEAARPEIAPETGKSSFSDVLKTTAADTLRDARVAEQTMQKGLAGEATTQAIVESTIALEHTVKVAVSVRDKFVEAYQEVLRMPI